MIRRVRADDNNRPLRYHAQLSVGNGIGCSAPKALGADKPDSVFAKERSTSWFANERLEPIRRRASLAGPLKPALLPN